MKLVFELIQPSIKQQKAKHLYPSRATSPYPSRGESRRDPSQASRAVPRSSPAAGTLQVARCHCRLSLVDAPCRRPVTGALLRRRHCTHVRTYVRRMHRGARPRTLFSRGGRFTPVHVRARARRRQPRRVGHRQGAVPHAPGGLQVSICVRLRVSIRAGLRVRVRVGLRVGI